MDTGTWSQDLQAYEYNTMTREYRDSKRIDAWTKLPGRGRAGGPRPGDVFRDLDDGGSFTRAIERNSAPTTGLVTAAGKKIQNW